MPDRLLPEHGGQLRELAAQFAVPEDSLLDFSASINPLAPSDELIAKLCDHIRSRKLLIYYPDTRYVELKQALAAYAMTEAASVVIGNGVMCLLAAAIHALQIRKCLVLVPAFSEYRRVLAAAGAECFTLAVTEKDGFSIDCEQVLAKLRASRAQALLFANPQSPSGRLLPAAQLDRLREATFQLGVTTLVDEAFIDYLPEASLSGRTARLARLIVFRSLTKFFAMPGLRVAYAVAHPALRSDIEAVMPLWPVSSVAAEAARLALQDASAMASARAVNARERDWLAHQLSGLGLTVFPSSANYLLVKVADNWNGYALWQKLIVSHGIVVRSCANFEGLNEQYFRVGVRTRRDNQRLAAALASLLSC
jgi:threonine-phosphate decarboxylase